MKKTIDLNADVGEGCANDAALFEIVSSANIACGWHAGDERTMRDTVRAALRHGVRIGAHPSYPDRANFGRTPMERSPDEVYSDVVAQLRALETIAGEEGSTLHHVKAHGALYNAASQDRRLADAIVRAARDVDVSLAVVGLAGGAIIDAARAAGMRAIEEGFADRRYTADGSLVPRSEPNALIERASDALEQTLHLLDRGIRTVCVHGDGPYALLFARTLRDALTERGVTIAPF